jgi:hypothetical protein
MRNEPNFRVFRFGRISYGGVHVGLWPPAESPATFQFPKVVEEGWRGVDEAGLRFGFEGEAGAVADSVGGEEAAPAPVVFDEKVDEDVSEDANGLELVVVHGSERGEIGGVLAGGGLVSDVDAGFECIYARDVFAWLGARAGGEPCTAAIGLNLYLDRHRASASPTVAGEPARFREVGWEVIEGIRRV